MLQIYGLLCVYLIYYVVYLYLCALQTDNVEDLWSVMCISDLLSSISMCSADKGYWGSMVFYVCVICNGVYLCLSLDR